MKTPKEPRVRLSVAGVRAYHGRPVVLKKKLTDSQVAQLGEAIVKEYFRITLKTLNVVKAGAGHYAIDIVAGQFAIEAKAGTVGNGPGAQHWRLTIGEPSADERSWLALAAPEEKSKHNAVKRANILNRKALALRELEVKYQRHLQPTTATVIIDPDKALVDIFTFEGWHERIGWSSPEAARGFAGSWRYDPV